MREADVVIIGAGIAGVICAKYAADFGLKALMVERAARAGGLWRDLPDWQDIQIRKEDWTLGPIPIDGVDRRSVCQNIESWIEAFELKKTIRFNTEVIGLERCGDRWKIKTNAGDFHSSFVIAATGAFNRPLIPPIARRESKLDEAHSSELRRPEDLVGKRVAVVGAGASAMDLLEVALKAGAAEVSWIFRSPRWMFPTAKKKAAVMDLRGMARAQLLGASAERINRKVNAVLQARYRKFGLEEILPDRPFDFTSEQLLPGRALMIAKLQSIRRFRSSPVAIDRHEIALADGQKIEADCLLWGTGYSMDLKYLSLPLLSGVASLKSLSNRIGGLFLSNDYPNLFVVGPTVLSTNGSAPWGYAHAAKAIMLHIRGKPVFDQTIARGNYNYYDLAKYLARRSMPGWRYLFWHCRQLARLMTWPNDKPLPMP